jgi:16S rRNA (cytosine1402-N4)-methyltransferase
MQFDNPARGFSFKHDGPLDMRMNPQRGQPARAWLASVSPEALARVLEENADEPEAGALAAVLAGRDFPTTTALVNVIRRRFTDPEEAEACTRRVFQAVRIAVNDEFSALDNLLRVLPTCVKSGGRIAMLSFHSGEDRRVKHAFAAGQRDGVYAAVTEELLRPSAEERRANPRASSARLRWAVRA